MRRRELLGDCRGAVSVLFGAAAVPIVGVVGLAVDYDTYAQAYRQMQVAADGAALSATKVAASEFVQGIGTWNSDAVTNGTQWYTMQVSKLREASTTGASVGVAQPGGGTTFNGTVSFSGSVPAHFARLFGDSSFPVSGQASATITINAYVNITLLLDNSSSMLIGASQNDVNTLQAITACSPESMNSNQGMGAWTGPTPSACPTSYTGTSGVTYTLAAPTAGQTPVAAPCGFACHWSNDNQTIPGSGGKPDYTRYDYYNLAKNPAHGAYPNSPAAQLRFDVVQAATSDVIQTMQSDEVFSSQFGAAIYTFGSGANLLTKYYPATGEAGTDLSNDATGAQTAAASIATPVVSNDGDTDFPDAATKLATDDLTPAGDGSTASSPRKDLFIVTDGMLDYTPSGGSRTLQPWTATAAVTACNKIKSMGIGIYILYTPYTPLPYNPFYVSNIAKYVNNPPTPNDIMQGLNACASSQANVYEADLPSQIKTGLNALLKAAINTPVRISS